MLEILSFVMIFIPALARLFHSLGSKVILASRNTQNLERIKFQLDSEHKVGLCRVSQ